MSNLRNWIRGRPKKGDPVDPTPVAIPAFVKQPDDLKTRIRNAVKYELSQRAARTGFGTFEEEDDFVPEEELPPITSGFEVKPYRMAPVQEDGRVATPDDVDVPPPTDQGDEVALNTKEGKE